MTPGLRLTCSCSPICRCPLQHLWMIQCNINPSDIWVFYMACLLLLCLVFVFIFAGHAAAIVGAQMEHYARHYILWLKYKCSKIYFAQGSAVSLIQVMGILSLWCIQIQIQWVFSLQCVNYWYFWMYELAHWISSQWEGQHLRWQFGPNVQYVLWLLDFPVFGIMCFDENCVSMLMFIQFVSRPTLWSKGIFSKDWFLCPGVFIFTFTKNSSHHLQITITFMANCSIQRSIASEY
jgi:hypothetical protein